MNQHPVRTGRETRMRMRAALGSILFIIAAAAIAGIGRADAAPPPPKTPASKPAGAPSTPFHHGNAHFDLRPDVAQRARAQLAGSTRAAASTPLNYDGGPVMNSTTTYAVFWLPSGYHFEPSPMDNATGDTNYENFQ